MDGISNHDAAKAVAAGEVWLPADLPWYAVKVRTRAEERVAGLIAAKGYRAYVPTYTETRQYSDRVKKVRAALFPGYVFCSLDIQRRLPVLTIPGVESFVSFNNEPAEVPEAELSAIHAAIHSGLGVHPCEYLREGDRVRVVVGSMRGVEGVLVKEKSRDRLVVSVDVLQRSVSVEVERDWLAPV